MREAFINRLAVRVHRVWPTWLRSVPDLSVDLNGASEHKLAVPGYAQLDGYSCGATAGWAVVKTFHPQASFRSFYHACNPSLDGTTDARVIRALRCHGGRGVRASRPDLCQGASNDPRRFSHHHGRWSGGMRNR